MLLIKNLKSTNLTQLLIILATDKWWRLVGRQMKVYYFASLKEALKIPSEEIKIPLSAQPNTITSLAKMVRYSANNTHGRIGAFNFKIMGRAICFASMF
jgi:hypothetical protein